MYRPQLIETGVKSYMHNMLKTCYDSRIKWYSFAFNMLILAIFAIIALVTLWYCRKRQLSPEERARKLRYDQELVLTKIREYQMQKNMQNEQMSQLIRRVDSIDTTPLSQETATKPHVDLIYDMAMNR
jgi:hypothetical protein